MNATSIKTDHEKVLMVIDQVNETVQSDILDWEDKYYLCFNLINTHNIRAWLFWKDYYDPHGSHQDDVLALHNHLQELRPKAVEAIRITNSSSNSTD